MFERLSNLAIMLHSSVRAPKRRHLLPVTCHYKNDKWHDSKLFVFCNCLQFCFEFWNFVIILCSINFVCLCCVCAYRNYGRSFISRGTRDLIFLYDLNFIFCAVFCRHHVIFCSADDVIWTRSRKGYHAKQVRYVKTLPISELCERKTNWL